MDLKISILSIEFSWDVYILGFRGYGLVLGMEWLSCFGAILGFVCRIVRLMTRLGKALEISSNPMGPVMLCYLESLNSSIDSLQLVRVVREYPDILGKVKGGYP